MGAIALESKEKIEITSMCSVFAESEVISLIAQNKEKADIANGVCGAIANKAFRPAAARGPGTGFHDDRRRGEKSRCCAGSGGEDRIEALHMRGAGDCRRNRSGTLRSGADGGVGFCRLAAERLAAEEERFPVPRVHNPGTNWSYCEKRKGDHGYDTVGLQCDRVQIQ